MDERNGFFEVAARRRSVRSFSDRPVEAEKLARIMAVGRQSASADNRQPWRFYLLLDEARAGFGKILRERFREAPVLIVACAHPEEAWVRPYDGRNFAWVDVAIAVTEMVLAATAQGLGSCWVASFDPDAAREMLGLDGAWEPVAALALGYPVEPSARGAKKRKIEEEVWEIRNGPA